MTLEKEINALRVELAEKEAETQQIVSVIQKLCVTLGIVDETTMKMKQTLKDNPNQIQGTVMESLSDVMGKLMSMKMNPFPSQRKKAEDAILDKFAFLSEIGPIIDKYSK
jgi:hypothetical protein